MSVYHSFSTIYLFPPDKKKNKKKKTPFHKCKQKAPNKNPSPFHSLVKRSLAESDYGSWYNQNEILDSSEYEETIKLIEKKPFYLKMIYIGLVMKNVLIR